MSGSNEQSVTEPGHEHETVEEHAAHEADIAAFLQSMFPGTVDADAAREIIVGTVQNPDQIYGDDNGPIIGPEGQTITEAEYLKLNQGILETPSDRATILAIYGPLALGLLYHEVEIGRPLTLDETQQYATLYGQDRRDEAHQIGRVVASV